MPISHLNNKFYLNTHKLIIQNIIKKRKAGQSPIKANKKKSILEIGQEMKP